MFQPLNPFALLIQPAALTMGHLRGTKDKDVKNTADQFKDAAWEGNIFIVKEYVEGGGDVNACASNGVSALVTFNTSILEYLFQH